MYELLVSACENSLLKSLSQELREFTQLEYSYVRFDEERVAVKHCEPSIQLEEKAK